MRTFIWGGCRRFIGEGTKGRLTKGKSAAEILEPPIAENGSDLGVGLRIRLKTTVREQTKAQMSRYYSFLQIIFLKVNLSQSVFKMRSVCRTASPEERLQH